MAHFALTSACTSEPVLPSPAGSMSLIDNFYLSDLKKIGDPILLEFGASQALFIGGFFREQIRRRHNPSIFDGLGSLLYSEASCYSRDKKQREMFGRMAIAFPLWARICSNLNKTFQENAPNQYLLRLN